MCARSFRSATRQQGGGQSQGERQEHGRLGPGGGRHHPGPAQAAPCPQAGEGDQPGDRRGQHRRRRARPAGGRRDRHRAAHAAALRARRPTR